MSASALDLDFPSARRIELDAHSWVEHVPNWLAADRELFEELIRTAGWEQRERWMYNRRLAEPRLTAEYQDVSQAPQQLRTVTAELAARYAVDYRFIWLNLYRDQRDSTSWHGDPIGKRQETSTVPVLSLGATRRFLIKPAQGGKSLSFTVASGDLIVMGGRAQRDWRHCVPKQQTPAGPRISINFAPAVSG
jgi:alkylated DNA repair dioxygenase AlkB